MDQNNSERYERAADQESLARKVVINEHQEQAEPAEQNARDELCDWEDPSNRRIRKWCIQCRAGWKKAQFYEKCTVALTGIGLFVLIAYTVFTALMWSATKRAADAAKIAADAANASIRTSQQSYVTVGRQDGTVAEIVWPKNPEGKAGIVVYFRNNGHLPAKFNWGTKNEIIAVLPNDPNIPVGAPKASSSGVYEVRTNNVFKPMWRARNRKTGNFMGSNVTMIGGDSLYAGSLWEVPKDRMVQMQNSALWTVGTFEYCDAFHNYVCRNFTLIYRREPYNRFMVVSEEECLGPEHAIIHPDPDLEYLSPCATGTEREETRIFQGMQGWVYPEH